MEKSVREHLQYMAMKQLWPNSLVTYQVNYVEVKKNLVSMYQQTSWLTGYKIPSVTVSVGHSQPSQFLLHTALELVLRGTVFFEQQKDPSSSFFLFNGRIDHENKADDKENNNANKKTVRQFLCPKLSPLFRPLGVGEPRMCPPRAERLTRAALWTNCNGNCKLGRYTFLGPDITLGFLPFSSRGKLSPGCSIILLNHLWENGKAQRGVQNHLLGNQS